MTARLRGWLLVGLSLAACELAGSAGAVESAGVAGSMPAYERKAWRHWVDADGDCQDARTEVLITESYGRVEFEDSRHCEVESGEWQCPYTGEIFREPHLLDVDHMVPLANAHRSGGGAWDDERRRQYANELGEPNHLIAVEAGANRAKSDKGPEDWLPPSEEYRCTYVRDWVAVKQRWGLSMTSAETAAVERAIAVCNEGGVPELPQTSKPKRPAKPEAEREQPVDGECCRVCKKGKACGDACVAKDAECDAAPGCACDQ